MGTIRFCLTESIASKAPAGSQVKVTMRGRSCCAARQRPESKPPPPTCANTMSRSATWSTRPSPSLDRLSRTDGYTVEPRPPDSNPRVRATLHQYSSDFRLCALEPHSPEPHDASWRRTVWASRHVRWLPEDDRPRKSLPMIP